MTSHSSSGDVGAKRRSIGGDAETGSNAALTQPPVFDPTAPGFFDDPYAMYARMRDGDPAHRAPLGLILFDYDQIQETLLRKDTTMNLVNVPGFGVRGSGELYSRGVLGLDPPDHTRVRMVMMKAFTPRAIDQVAVGIASDLDMMLSAMEEQWRDSRAPIDLMQALAVPLPFNVISRILGMPEPSPEQIHEWCAAVALGSVAASRDDAEKGVQAYRKICDYVVKDVLPWKRKHPTDDLLSVLLAAHDSETLSFEEMIDQVSLLYVAGHETTTGLIGNSVLNLLRNRREFERVRDDRKLAPRAVDELNRYDSAIQFTWRYMTEATTVGGKPVEVGEMVLLCVGSANRDAAHFGPTADQLDLTRDNAREALSFGGGIHFCLGSALAKREAAMVIDALATRFPDIELAGKPQWNPRLIFRALDHLPVALGR